MIFKRRLTYAAIAFLCSIVFICWLFDMPSPLWVGVSGDNFTAETSDRYVQDMFQSLDQLRTLEHSIFNNMRCSQIPLTSTKYSRVMLSNITNGIATVEIDTFISRNVRKRVGGDVILLWAKRLIGTGRSAGEVNDNMDGTYTGRIRIYWTGPTVIQAKVASSCRNACLRHNALRRYGNTAYALRKPWGIIATFKNGRTSEETRCGTSHPLYGYSKACNFTVLNDNIPWYCGHPSKPGLTCDHVYAYNTGTLVVKGLGKNETRRDSSYGFFNANIKLNVETAVVIRDKATGNVSCARLPSRLTWTKTSRDYMDQQYVTSGCRGMDDHSPEKYRKCLQNKTIVFLGDSTIRQYFEYVTENVLGMRHIDKSFHYGPNRTYHSSEVFRRHNISTLFRKHEMPFHNPDVRPHGVKSLPTLLTELANSSVPDDSLIVVVNYYAHLQSQPPSDYRLRLRRLNSAIKVLLAAKPRTKIFYKSPNVVLADDVSHDSRVALMFRDILFEEFRDLMDHVTYLDVWGITVAHNSHDLHPQGECFTHQIQQLMAYVCS